MSDERLIICNWCNQPSVLVWVHGHGQCSVCGTIIDECCRGGEAHLLTSSQKEVEKEKDKND